MTQDQHGHQGDDDERLTNDVSPDDHDLAFYWTKDLSKQRRKALEERMATDPEWAAKAEEFRKTLEQLRSTDQARPNFEADAFFEDRITPHLSAEGFQWKSWALKAAALVIAFTLGFVVAQPKPEPKAPVQSNTSRLRLAYQASTKADDGLTRGLLALSALSRRP